MAIDPINDDLYVAVVGFGLRRYNSDCEFQETVFGGLTAVANDVDVWHAEVGGEEHFDLYVVNRSGELGQVQIFDGETHALKETIETGAELSEEKYAKLAVDQTTGDVYFADIDEEDERVLQFCRDPEAAEGEEFAEEPCATIEHGLETFSDAPDLAVDGSPTSPNQGYLFVGSKTHLWAFAPLEVNPPEVVNLEQAVSQITSSTATLSGRINPNGAVTTYSLQYTTEADYQEMGFEGAIVAAEGEIAADAPPTPVSAAISGLAPGGAYRFGVFAENHCNPLEEEEVCGDEGVIPFATYAPPDLQPACPNAALRVGLSAALPDCRAYEMVSPADSAGRVPAWGVTEAASAGRDSALARADGQSLLFLSSNGALPGSGGNGVFDAYRAQRGAAGWTVAGVGPNGEQMRLPEADGFSSDHAYSAWLANIYGGSLDTGCFSHYLRGPDGAFELVGRGSLGEDVSAVPRLIAPGAEHVVFETGKSAIACNSATQLEPDAPPDGTDAIYDRSPGAPTKVVSLLPGEVTPSTDTSFVGAALDGSVVLFRVGGDSTLYARLDNASTVAVVEPDATFAGVSDDGERVFYLLGGDIFACEPDPGGCAGPGSSPPTQIGSGGESQVVNVSADGSRLYFASEAVLSGAEANEAGEVAEAGEENLYLWEAASEEIAFLARLDVADFAGDVNLSNWMPFGAQRFKSALDPSRTTPDGSAIVFQSRAKLSDYDNEGRVEVYRYEASSGALDCVSCNPTAVPPGSDARLQSFAFEDVAQLPPISNGAPVANLSADGSTVFFESAERLVLGDVDGLDDVYRWRAAGTGGCERQGGCLALISHGQSASPDYLFAATPSGDDVFFETSDSLLGADHDGGVPSVYDARVGGGFPEASAEEPCQPGACQGAGPEPPPLGVRSDVPGPGNLRPASRRCAKLARRAKRLSRRAKRLRRAARRASGARSRTMRRRAAGNMRRAKRLSRKASSCRGKKGGKSR